MTRDRQLVGVVVPTRNNERVIGACLQSIKQQTYDCVDVAVVDNNSMDRTAEIARQYTDKVFTRGPERSSQRNYGASMLPDAAMLLFIDSDMVLSPDVINDCVGQLQTDPAIAGVVIPEESFGRGFWTRCKSLERSFYLGVPYIEAARFFRADAFRQVGGYDEGMTGVEDWDLSQRMRKASPARRLGRTQAIIRHDEGHLTLRYLLQKKYYYALHMGDYTAKHANTRAQTSPLQRYRLFLSKPRVLFAKPHVGGGMLLMKTAEFAAGGLGVTSAAWKRRRSPRTQAT